MQKKLIATLAAMLVLSLATPAQALNSCRIKRYAAEATMTALTAMPGDVCGGYAVDTGALWLWTGSAWVQVASGSGFEGTNGGIIDNETNNAWTFAENSEDLVLTFGANDVAVTSSTGVTEVDFGTINVETDEIDANGTGTLTILVNGENMVWTGTSNMLTASSGTGAAFTFTPAVTVTGTLTASNAAAVGTTLSVAGVLTPNGMIDARPFSVAFDEGASKGLSLLETDGTAYVTTADTPNYLIYGGTKFNFETITTAAGTVTPVAAATGLDIQGAAVGIADEWVMGVGQLDAVSQEIVVGTTPAWQACATWVSTVVAQQAAMFLEVTSTGVPVAFAASDPNYTSYAAIGQVAGDIYVSDNTTGGTDTTDDWANAESHAVCILGDGAGVITYTLDGSAPSATDPHTLGDGVPHVIRIQGLTVTGTTSQPILTAFSFSYQ